jgi:hypothetical protein
MNKELYVCLFTYNAFVALRRPVGFSQGFVVSPYPNNSNAVPMTLRCCYDTGKHTLSVSPHLNFWRAEFKSQCRILMTWVRIVSMIEAAHMQSMDTNTCAAIKTCRSSFSGFGGLEVPKFAGSNPAEAVGFFRAKNPQHAFLRRGSKAVGPMSEICGM